MVAGSPLDSLTLPQLMDRLKVHYENPEFKRDVLEALDFKPAPGTDDIRLHLERLSTDWAEGPDEQDDILEIVCELWYDHDMPPQSILEHLDEGWEGTFEHPDE